MKSLHLRKPLFLVGRWWVAGGSRVGRGWVVDGSGGSVDGSWVGRGWVAGGSGVGRGWVVEGFPSHSVLLGQNGASMAFLVAGSCFLPNFLSPQRFSTALSMKLALQKRGAKIPEQQA